MSAPKIKTPEELYQVSSAFMQSRVILSAYELEVFDAVAKEGSGSGEVAKRLETDPRATDRLMNALCTIGLLNKKHGLFHHTELSSKYLRRKSPDFMAGLGHRNTLWDAWGTLSAAVRKGSSVRESRWNKKHRSSFIAAMNARANEVAEKVAASLDLQGVRRILDVGGGSGAFAMEFLKKDERISATVFDTPEVIPLTRQYVEEAGFSGRVDYIEGDYHLNELGRGYDLVFMSSIIHINSFEQNLELIAKGSRSLNNNGRLVVRDFVVDEDRTRPGWGVMFALNMLVNTKCGDTYTKSEIKKWFDKAGLKDFEIIGQGKDSELIVGRKP
jgi:ubiquinone/menaquinone biosynthesis C-methylase UbiE